MVDLEVAVSALPDTLMQTPLDLDDNDDGDDRNANAKSDVQLVGAPKSNHILVHFDDGPEAGICAAICEEDVCDNKYWVFEESHGHNPVAKIVFADGACIFVGCWPDQVEGKLIDEDGDQHRYEWSEPRRLCEQRASAASSVVLPPIAKVCSGEPHDSGVRATSNPEMGRARRRKQLDADDEDWNAKPRQSQTKRPRRAADSGSSSVCTNSDKAVDSKPSVGVEHLTVSQCVAMQKDEPAEESVRPAVAPTTALAGAPATLASASQEAEMQQMEAPKEAYEDDSQGIDAPGAHDEQTPKGKRDLVTIERAKSSRSSCKSCGLSISANAWRCGVDVYSSGGSKTHWTHSQCFLADALAEYSVANRGKCKGSGESFAVGDIKVGLKVGCHQTWFRPAQAAHWTTKLLRQATDEERVELEGKLNSFAGIDPDHQIKLVTLLRTGQCEGGAEQLRGEPSVKKKASKRQTKKAQSSTASANAEANLKSSDSSAAIVAEPTGEPLDLDDDSDDDGLELVGVRHENQPVS